MSMNNGFLLTIGNKAFFYNSKNNNLTKQVLHVFIDKIGEYKNLSTDLIERCKNDEGTLKDLRYRISKATLEKYDNGKVQFYNITGKNFIMNIPLRKAECLIIF